MESFSLSELRVGREPAVDRLMSVVSPSWARCYDGDALAIARFTVGRAIALIGPSIDCLISFARAPIESVSIVNPDRIDVTPDGGYPLLRQMLEGDPHYDSIPLSLGKSKRGLALWDGHRRLETYRAAGRVDVPGWISIFRNGSGMLRIG